MRISGSVTSSTTAELADASSGGGSHLSGTAPARPADGVSDRVSGVARVEAPGRLHLGFLDPSATLGRRFGSVALAIEGMATVVEASFDTVDTLVAGEGACRDEVDRARAHVATLRRLWQVGTPL